MCKFSSKSGGGVPFQISFFLGDLTRNDPIHIMRIAIIPYIWLYILPINTNPLTSNHYKWIHVHSKTTQSDCIVMPITAEYNTNIATNLDQYNSDSEDFNENNLINNSELYVRNNFDYLENIDPDVNLLDSDPVQKCNYYSQPEFHEKFNNTNDLSILHTNIRSSKKNIKQFLWYVNNLNVTFGFIGLSEVWGGNNHTIESQSIPGYTRTYDVRTKRNGGGVSLYVKKHIKFIERHDLKFDKEHFESVFIEVNKAVFSTKHNVIIGVLYRAPNSCLEFFNKNLEKVLNIIKQEKKDSYLMGDFNINTMYEMSCTLAQEQEFINLFSTLHYHKLINLPTRITQQSSSLLDNIYTTLPYHNTSKGVLISDHSDHYIVFTIQHGTTSTKAPTHREMRDFSEQNISKFKKKIKNTIWDKFYAIPLAQDAYSVFANYINNYFKECFPNKNVKINYRNKITWIGAKLKKEIAQKNKLLAISKRYPTEGNKRAYKSARNIVISKLRKAERKHYDDQLDLYGNDNHKKWKVIKEIIAKEDRSSTMQSEFIIDTVPTTNPEVIANSFNDFFVNVGKNLAENIKSDIDPLKYIANNLRSINTIQVTEDKILSIISAMKNSAPGFDELPAFLMKQCSKLFIKPLCHVLSLSIRQGVFPIELKLAKVLPIYKSDDKRQLKNYRPISVLPFISKIFEKIVADSVIDFLEDNDILYSKQFGFRKRHSTTHAIIALTEKVSMALDSGKIVGGVFLDLKKAFDCVSHDILLNKLYAYGIRGSLMQWFQSYLSARSQFVFYNGIRSSIRNITHGVPQGSILGPLLFILNVNDFSRSSDLLFSILFADDTSVFIEGHSYAEVIEILNNELLKVSDWLMANKLTINLEKKSLYDIP